MMALLFAALSLAGPSELQPPPEPRYRTALFLSNNEAAGRTRLLYADTDSAKLASVLSTLGGFVDSEQHQDASAGDLRAALDALATRVASARTRGMRTEVVVYYSGHSDAEGLLLESERVSYGEIKQRIDAIGADVQVAILDSCASGALIRAKGSAPHAPFLLDRSSLVSGTAVLTSSSADEASQESDRIEGSFFTHALVSGLRGAADTSNDRRVSLIEAYHFAYSETLARTEHTLSGAQHAAYALDLSGTGDLVMTDLNTPDATLQIDLPDSARVFVWGDRYGLVAEVSNAPEKAVALALPSDTYRVFVDRDGLFEETSLALASGESVSLSRLLFHPAESSWTRLRSGDRLPVRHQIVSVNVLPPLLTGPRPDAIVTQHVSISLGASAADRLDGVALALGGNLSRGHVRGAQLSFGFNSTRERSDGLQLAMLGGNLSREVRGAQIAAGFNASRRVSGAQLGAIVEVADEIDGMQLGLVNIGGSVSGAQVGLVNIARSVDGAQIGLFNLAGELDGAALGIVSVARDGYNHAWVFSSDLAPIEASVTYGGKRVYSLFSLGRSTASLGLIGFGLGWHTPIRDRLLFDADLSALDAGDGPRAHLMLRARALFGVSVARRLSVVGGPTFSVVPIGDPDELTFMPILPGDLPAWPGATIGMRW